MLNHQQGNFAPPTLRDKRIENIVILVAMRSEAKPIIDSLQLRKTDAGLSPQLQLQSYCGEIAGRNIHLVVNGIDPYHSVDQVGTEAATLSAYDVITHLHPDTIISAGTAGGFAERGAALGDVVISRGEFLFHDHDIPVNSDYEDYGKGLYPCLEAPLMAHYLRLKSGIISTGNSLTVNAREQQRLHHYGAIAKEMEVAAIAKIARQFNTRVMAVKAITNIVGIKQDPAAEFKQNFDLATENLARVIPNIIHYLLGKTPQQLQQAMTIEECVA